VEPEGQLRLEDLVTDRRRLVASPSPVAHLARRHVLLAQVVSLDGEDHLAAAGPFALPANGFLDDLRRGLGHLAHGRRLEPGDLFDLDFDLIELYLTCLRGGARDVMGRVAWKGRNRASGA
jgi:hypothetical protein